jgi:glycosyltransferase involved in cell wall biosynthesis
VGGGVRRFRGTLRNRGIPVALVYRNFSVRGSIENDHVFLARALAERGVDVHCFGMASRRTADAPGVTHHDVHAFAPSRGRFGYALECTSFAVRATRELRRRQGEFAIVDVSGTDAWDADVVTAHAVVAAEEERVAGRSTRDRARTMLTPLLSPREFHCRIVESLQYRSPRLQRVIARTAEVKQDVTRIHGIAPDMIDVIPYAVDGARLAAARREWLRNDLGLPPATPLVAFVGRIVDEKGIGIAIRAFADLPGAHLVAFGSGDIEHFRAVAQAAGVADRVHFPGHTDRPEDVYADADVFLLPSRRDVWGIPVIEAMAAGVPVVCSSAAGAAGAAEQADAGIVVDPEPEAVAAALAALLADPERRRRLGENGKIAARRFSPAAYVGAVLQAYAAALARRSERAAPLERAKLVATLAFMLELL